jgi:hypothetical protein
MTEYGDVIAVIEPKKAVFDLKVVGNEKVGGSGRWQMIRIYLGPW